MTNRKECIGLYYVNGYTLSDDTKVYGHIGKCSAKHNI